MQTKIVRTHRESKLTIIEKLVQLLFLLHGPKLSRPSVPYRGGGSQVVKCQKATTTIDTCATRPTLAEKTNLCNHVSGVTWLAWRCAMLVRRKGNSARFVPFSIKTKA